ncbi:MAG: type 1 glutamine amidotransferase domain-containing protein [Deferrisomatales bacterium]|nr:type 1 glutamine amidotransferase domain-containing protein [Deferrisomatales bacterium]
MRLKGRKIALFLENLYEDQEFWYPYRRLREEGAEVTVVAPRADSYASKHGAPARADIAVGDARAEHFDALVIPGGYAPDHMRRVPAMVDFVREMHDEGKVVAAICHAGWMLASAEIVKGRKVTGFFSIKDDLVHAGAEWLDREVVRDGNLITSRTPDDLPAFCRTLIESLA